MSYGRVSAVLTFVIVAWFTAASSRTVVAGEVLDRIVDRGFANVAIVPDTPPLTFVDQQGELHGFDVDVAREVTRRLGAVPVFVTPPWTDMLSGNWGTAIDMAVASITPTVERGANLVFPAVYRLDGVVLVVRADNKQIRSPKDASGKTIGVKAATTFERYLKGETKIFVGDRSITPLISHPLIRSFPDNADALKALINGTSPRLDGVVTSLARAKAAVSDGLPVRIVPGFLYFEPVAIAVAKGDPQLAEKIKSAVDDMRQDGTLSNLSIRWFGIDLTS